MSLPEGHPRLAKRPFTQGELVADGVLHAFALLAAIIGLAVLIVLVIARKGGLELSAVVIYGIGLLAMFGFSAAYNLVPPSSLKWILRRFDHSAIFVMIAGTYTPLLTQLTDQTWAILLAVTVWVGAVIGIVVKVALPGHYDRLSVVAYLALGWVAIVAIKPLLRDLPETTLLLVAIGGLIYSAGVIFYAWKSLKFHNVIWHGFVTVAAGCHYAAIAHAMVR